MVLRKSAVWRANGLPGPPGLFFLYLPHSSRSVRSCSGLWCLGLDFSAVLVDMRCSFGTQVISINQPAYQSARVQFKVGSAPCCSFPPLPCTQGRGAGGEGSELPATQCTTRQPGDSTSLQNASPSPPAPLP